MWVNRLPAGICFNSVSQGAFARGAARAFSTQIILFSVERYRHEFVL